MKNFRSLLRPLVLCLCIGTVALQSSCRKDDTFHEEPAEREVVNMNTYDYLKSKRGIYDSLVFLIDRLGLADTLKNETVTLFAPTNESFKLAITNLNNLRASTGKSPLFLANIDTRHLDTLLTKYIIKGAYPSDSLTKQDGLMFYGVKYQRMMHAKKLTSSSSGYGNGGPAYIQFDDTKQSIFNRYWSTTTTGSIDIQTNNGFVHIVEPNHVFGFDEFVSRITFIPKVNMPFYGTPLTIPGVINAVDFDLGGPGLGYADSDDKNDLAYYRSAEGVDIATYNGGFKVEKTVSGEWLAYTVSVAEDGDYDMMAVLASGGDGRRFSLEVDGVNVTGIQAVPNTGANNTFGGVSTTVPLTKGKHIIRFNIVTGGFDVYQLIFTPKMTNVPDGLTATWLEHWGNHNQFLRLFDYTDHIAVYHDQYMFSSVTWPKQVFSDAWAYVKQTYGGNATFGTDQRLRLILHRVIPATDNLGGGHPAHYLDSSHDFKNVLDCGLGDWSLPEGQNIGLPVHEMGHIVEDNIDGIKGSPTGVIWGDSKFMEIFNYDVYKKIGLDRMAADVVTEMEAKNPYRSYPGIAFPGVRWFTEWFYPIYNQHGKEQLLNKYFQVLRANFPRNGNRIERSKPMNLGEFVHFYSGAAGVDLSAQARIAFNPALGADHWPDKDEGDPKYWPPYKAPQYWTEYGEAQFQQAKRDFPNVRY
ncbi:endoglucanase-related protein [Pedobacter sp. BAL39]|uniref:carbohydrate-binding protein n=1 Tax=Pedobacter sp. BAL39 TaxID=391596 RepID=UPI000155A142|nr:carbohydrate-binding protein [Pedobacter sp. BAL39]EDM35584.1 endoglucanase-related protein [Pedobacter sp. BAL39]